MRLALFAPALALALCHGAPALARGETPAQFNAAQAAAGAPSVAVEAVKRAAAIVRASWYGGGERLNRRTSTGEIFQPGAHTAAHRSLPFGTRVEVTNLANGRVTVVRINDRGPAQWTGRDIDLARGAASDLGMIAAGETRVALRILN